MESLVIDPSFWNGKHVFLTGHTGFKGSWLSIWLKQLGAEVTGLALNPPTEPSGFCQLNVESFLKKHIIADIRDLDALTSAMQQAEPDIVIHMAAQSLVRESYTDPVGTYATNVMGTVHLLEAVRKTPSIKAVLNITTDKCYENKEWAWGYRENEPLGGYDPYSSSKGCAELVSSAYRLSFLEENGIALATARAGNVIGGGDWAKDRIVPDAMRAFISGQALRVRNPNSIRPWQHVLEPLSGYLMLCQQLYQQPMQFAEAWNFGPQDEDAQPVSVLVKTMMNAWGAGAEWETDKGPHPHEAKFLKLDCSKAKTLLHWHPVWNLQRALEETVYWYQAWHHQEDIQEFTQNQIQRYQQEHLAL